MDWPTLNGHVPIAKALELFGVQAYEAPHLCDVPDCPGPKLVARLEVAAKLERVFRGFRTFVAQHSMNCNMGSDLAAWQGLAQECIAAWEAAK